MLLKWGFSTKWNFTENWVDTKVPCLSSYFFKFDQDEEQQQFRISLLYNILFTQVSNISTLPNKMFTRDQQITTLWPKVIVLLVGVDFMLERLAKNANWVKSLLGRVDILLTWVYRMLQRSQILNCCCSLSKSNFEKITREANYLGINLAFSEISFCTAPSLNSNNNLWFFSL